MIKHSTFLILICSCIQISLSDTPSLKNNIYISSYGEVGYKKIIFKHLVMGTSINLGRHFSYYWDTERQYYNEELYVNIPKIIIPFNLKFLKFEFIPKIYVDITDPIDINSIMFSWRNVHNIKINDNTILHIYIPLLSTSVDYKSEAFYIDSFSRFDFDVSWQF